jgi:flagellar biosynthesis protein FlhF
MQHTLSDLRASVERLMRQQQTQLWPRDLPVVRTIYQHLIAQELDGQLSLEVVGQVSDEVNEGKSTDPVAVMKRVRELISDRIQVGHIAPNPSGPTVIVLVGPTGVGKTTTLAKLAAHLSMQENQRVALVTTDTFRIAAASQLGTYADLMELPLEVAYSPDELRAAVDRQSDADYILVDSPGCAQRNDAQIRELAAFVETLPGATVLLTVAATVKLRDLIDIQDGFGVLPIGGLVLTKLDETTVFGPAMSLVARSASKNVPVFYVTSGQNVPTDLEEATHDRLTDLVVGQLLDEAVANLVGKGGPSRQLVSVGDAR